MKKNIVIIALVLCNVAFGTLAYVQKIEADDLRTEAALNADEAIRQKQLAERARAEAEQQRLLAQANEKRALEAYMKMNYDKKK